MTNLDLARLQFASTSIYHFLFVPVTIGLAFLVALLQTTWHRRGDEAYLRLTRFFGTLLVINIAIGVVTGLVQEFQFGMNWSAYSRYVGDVFGAPLAIEGLGAFFLESVFLGLWLFGWGRLSPRVHLATIWAVAVGAALSAAFIMAANSWMQHPVGYAVVNGKAQLTNIWSVMTNPVFVWGYLHVLLASLVTGSAVMLAVSAWHLKHDVTSGSVPQDRVALARRAAAGVAVRDDGRQPPRRDRDHVSADEGRGDGGAVGVLPTLFLLGLPDRRREERRDADQDHRDPPSAVAARGRSVGWTGRGPERAQPAIPAAVRGGELRPERLHPVLVDARDGLPGGGGVPDRAPRRVPPVAEEADEHAGGSCGSRSGPRPSPS